MKTTLRKELEEFLAEGGLEWSEIVHCTATDQELDKKFDAELSSGYPAFTVWTEGAVIFAANYDMDFWIASVPRNPCDIKTETVGGGWN